MAYIDLTPSIVTQTGSTWSSIYEIVTEDDTYSVLEANSTEKLYVRFGTPSLPKDALLNGIQVFYSARVSGTTGAVLETGLFLDNTYTTIGSARVSAALNNTEASGYMGGTTDKFTYDLRYGDINNNQFFGFYVKSASSHVSPIWVDSMYCRVHYTSTSYLSGTRSRFTGRSGSLYDVDQVDGVPNDSTSLIQRKRNGASPENQIKAEDVNLLGDALYNIEAAILSSTGLIYAADGQKLYVFAFTVTGACNTSDPSDAIIYGKVSANGSSNTYYNSFAYPSIKKTAAPAISGMVACYWTSAIAWIENGANRNNLYVGPTGVFFKRNGSSVDYSIGFTIVSSGIGTVTDATETTTGAFKGYKGSTFSALGASGTVYVKILAIGREF